MKTYNSLAEELPYWEIEKNNDISYLILDDGSLASGLEITPIDIECHDNDRVNQLTLALRSFVNTIPEGYALQIHVQIDSDFRNTLNKHHDLLSTSNIFLKSLDQNNLNRMMTEVNENRLYRPRIFAYLKTPKLKSGKFSSRNKFKKSLKNFHKDFDERLSELSENIFSLGSSLVNLELKAKKLSQTELTENIYRYLNADRRQTIAPPVLFAPKEIQVESEILKSRPELAIDSPRSQLVFGDLILDRSEFVLDQYRTRVLSLKTQPEMTIAGQMNDFLRLPFHYDLIFSFAVSNQAKEMKKLKSNQRMAKSLSNSNSAQVRDLESESKLNDTEDLINELIQTGQRIFVSQLLVVLRDENTKEGLKSLNAKTREILGKFKMLSGAECIQETVGAWKIFKSCLPGAPISLERGKRMKTNNLVDFLPLYGPRLGDEVPVVLLHNRLGSIVSINPFDPGITNYNSLVTGSAGSGKSFFNNCMLFQQMARGTKVYIIDIGGSYKKLTELSQGQYFEINLSEKYAINPFEIKNISQGPTSEKIKGLTSIIEQMVAEENQKLSKLERVLIEKAIAETFERTKKENRSPLLSDFEKTCKGSKEPELQKVAKLLYSWVGNSPFGKLLDRNGAIHSDSPITAFDLKGLSQYPDLQSVMILILTNFILDQVETDKGTSKKVILDEAWQFLQSQAAASFMEYAARTFRKTGSGITFITQGVEEIAQSAIGHAIINNTSTKVVMSQRGDIKLLTDTLKLNPQEVALVQSLEQRKGVYSEAFLISGENRQVIRIYPSPLEYWVSTSDAKDNKYLSELQSQGLGLEASVIKASKDYPFGINQSESKADT